MPTTGADEPDGGAVRPESALDLDHLRHQCLDDEALGRELLSLFRVEARALAAQLARDGLSPSLRADLAHRLRGSALAVGAREVADAAEAAEASARGACGSVDAAVEMSQALASLTGAVVRAAAEIDRLEAQPPER